MNALPLHLSRLVGVDERGNRVGEDHPRAKLSNAEIDLMFELREPPAGIKPLSYREIAEKFEVSKGYVSDILSDRRRRRSSYPVAFRRVAIPATARLVEPVRAAARFNGDL
jgi:hypothetical protein